MIVRQAVTLLMEFVDANPSISAPLTRFADVRNFLLAYRSAFGDRDVLDVSISDIGGLIEKEGVGEIIEEAFTKSRDDWREGWETLSALKYVNQEKLAWEWEASQPNSELVKLFARPDFAPKNVLEVGCADGINAIYMAQHGCNVTAVDISDAAIRLCRENAAKAKVSCEFIASDILDPKLRAGTPFDFIMDKECFHHIPLTRYQDYKRLIWSRLAPGGFYFLICHRYDEELERLGPVPFLGVLSNVIGFLTAQAGVRSTERNIRELFEDDYEIKSIERIQRADNLSHPFVCLMRKPAH